MYKSPIEVATILNTQVEQAVQSIHKEVENEIYTAIFNVGVNVDKDELIKAMQYDRGQYQKGYADGIKEFAKRFRELFSEYSGYDTLHTYEILDRIDAVEEEMVGGAE